MFLQSMLGSCVYSHSTLQMKNSFIVRYNALYVPDSFSLPILQALQINLDVHPTPPPHICYIYPILTCCQMVSHTLSLVQQPTSHSEETSLVLCVMQMQCRTQQLHLP